MLESEMKLSERSEFFISGSAFNQILRPLFFLQFRNGSRFPHPSPPSCAIWQAPDIFGYFSTDAPFDKSEFHASSIAFPISWRIYLFLNCTHSVAAYAFALASFRSLPFAVMPSTRPPFVTIVSPSNFVPAWKQ